MTFDPEKAKRLRSSRTVPDRKFNIERARAVVRMFEALRASWTAIVSQTIIGYMEQAANLLEAAIAQLERLSQVEAENATLREELADWRDSAKRAAESSCQDEQHCTCVPLLQRELATLKAQIPEIQTTAYAAGVSDTNNTKGLTGDQTP